MVSVWDAKQFPVASHLSVLQFLHEVGCQCPGFAGLQQYLDNQEEHKSNLWAKRDMLIVQDGLKSLVCAILGSISGLEPWSMPTAPRHSHCQPRPIFHRWRLMSMLIPFVMLVISLIFSALISMPNGAEGLSRRPNRKVSSSSFPAKPSMSSTKRNLVVVLLSMLTVPWRSSSASVIILSRKMLKRVGERTQLCSLRV